MRPTQLKSLSVVFVSALVMSSCVGSTPGDDAAVAEVENTPSSASELGGAAVAVVEDGTLSKSDINEAQAFWSSSMGISNARELNSFADIEEMASYAHAVIVGRVVGEVVGPTISGLDEPAGSEVTLVGYEVEVIELVRGSLPVGEKTIKLYTYLAPDTYSDVPALMFLAWTGQAYEDGLGRNTPEAIEAWDRAGYRLVSTQGLFVSTPEGSWNPISEISYGYMEDDISRLADPVAEEVRAMSFDDLTSLVGSG